MDGEESESQKRLREELDKPRTLLSLMRLARKRTKNAIRAEDLLSETIVQVLEEDGASWDRRFSFLSFMAFKLSHVYTALGRLRSVTEIPRDREAIDEEELSAQLGPEDALERSRTLREWDDLLGRLNSVLVKEDLKTAQCLELMADGRSVEEQATLLGWRVDQVYNAHRTIQRRGLEVRQAWSEEREALMHARREAIPPSEESRP